MTLYFVQCVKKGEDSMANPGAKTMELDARLGKPCNKILRNLIHISTCWLMLAYM